MCFLTLNGSYAKNLKFNLDILVLHNFIHDFKE